MAIIAANAIEAIPYFSAGLKGVARYNVQALDSILFVHMYPSLFLFSPFPLFGWVDGVWLFLTCIS